MNNMLIFCSCQRYSPTCFICRAGKRAYHAGRRAYRQGKSRTSPHAHRGYEIHWRNGWYDGRNANPNTAACRAVEEANRRREEAARLNRERVKIDRRIKALTHAY